jgi:PilZ domain
MAVRDLQATSAFATLPPSITASDRHTEALRELRATLQLSVKVWGMDSNGKPFAASAKTEEVSASGARLTGLISVNEGEVIGIQYGDHKGRFRVVWIGETGTDKAGQIGVKSLDETKCIWSAALDAQTMDHAQEVSGGLAKVTSEQAAPSAERRDYPRYHCNGEIEVKTASNKTAVRFRLTDLGLGGCYADTMSPLPVNTALDLLLKVAGLVMPAKGIVRTSHVSMGMGIEFVDLGAEQRKQLTLLLNRECGSQIVVATEPAAGNYAAIEPGVDALVRLLQKKGLLSRDEFLGELQKPQ